MYWGLAFWGLVFALVWGYKLFSWWRSRARDRHAEQLSAHLTAARSAMERREWPQAALALDETLALIAKYSRRSWIGRRLYTLPPPFSEREAETEASLHLDKGLALEQMQRLEEALAEYAVSYAIAEEHRLEAFRPVIALRQGSVLAQLERWKEAEEKLKQSAQWAKQHAYTKLQLSALRILIRVYQMTRSYAEAIAVVQEALRLPRALGQEFTVAVLLDSKGDIELALGRYEDALQSYEASLELLRKLGHARGQLMVEQDIARLYQASGDLDKAFAWLNVCLQEESRAENLANQAQIGYELACLHISNGEFREAGHLLEKSMALFRKLQDGASINLVGRTLMGLGITVQRQATADRMTFRDIERGSAKLKKEEES